MSRIKRSPWIDGSINPTIPGVYERFDNGWYAKWTGRHWMVGDSDKETAAQATQISRCAVGDPWRGLASDPNRSRK
jgi:hypothetical protein